MRAFRALFSLLAPAILVATWSADAEAYERQWQAGLSAGYTQLVNGGGTGVAQGSFPGVGASLSLTYGINDAWNVIGHIDTSFQPGATPVFIAGGGLGVSYVIDILRWVPWLGVTAGGYGISALAPCMDGANAACSTGRLGFSLLGGLDYQFTRTFSLGLTGRYGLLLLGNQNAVDHTISGMLRAQYIWGY